MGIGGRIPPLLEALARVFRPIMALFDVPVMHHSHSIPRKIACRAGISLPVSWILEIKNVKPTSELPKPTTEAKPVKLLSGGNPQIAKGDGDAPVQAYIAAMPGWKHSLGKRLDALIEREVPGVKKSVRWNSPFYGVEDQGYFLGIHCLTKYVKVTFFAGTSLHPAPPGGTPKSKDARWIDLYEDAELDEAQLATWVRQAAALPGWKL
jgi:hypothetical protein